MACPHSEFLFSLSAASLLKFRDFEFEFDARLGHITYVNTEPGGNSLHVPGSDVMRWLVPSRVFKPYVWIAQVLRFDDSSC
jgi:hypothetical protein